MSKFTLLGSVEEGLVLLVLLVDLNQLGSSEELHDHSGGDGRGDSELHEGTWAERAG